MKILFLTDIPPCKNYTGGLMIETMMNFLPFEKLALFTVVNPHLHADIDLKWDALPKCFLRKPFEKPPKVAYLRRYSHVLASLYTFCFELLHFVQVRYRVLPKLIEFIKEQKIDAVFVVLQSQTITQLAYSVSQKLDLPLFTHTWDALEWWLKSCSVSSLGQKRLLHKYDHIIQRSQSSTTASWYMSEHYLEKYQKHCLTLLDGLPSELAQSPAHYPHESETFIIAIAGQLYAQEEWQVLIEALSQVNWHISGRNIRIRILGGAFQHCSFVPTHFEYLGWHPRKQLIQHLSTADLLYLPYWFSEEFRYEASSSFPSKLIAYFASGRPVFCHAPDYASPARYIAKHEAGYLCRSLAIEEILKNLELAITDHKSYKKFSHNATNCFLKDFTLKKMREVFHQSLGISSV
ncbi:MAG: glycosyltransferase family 4 protein [Gammaproteobacteria bacterium]|nr:glycosyltransferase family 4 protein [Gammaproteobacteria bacterium]